MKPLRLAVQEQMVPGKSLPEKFEKAQKIGYASLELRGGDGFALAERIEELRTAKAAGVVMDTCCVLTTKFIGDFNPRDSEDAIVGLMSQLSVMAEIGGKDSCVVTPAAWGKFSLRLPPHVPPRDAAGDQEVLVGALQRLGEHADKVGSRLLLEPLNRYENHMVHTLGRAVELVEEAGVPGLGVVADTYHMNIEERKLRESIVQAGSHIGHVQLGDSDRHQPGTGHNHWQTTLKALDEIGYSGYMAMECNLLGEPMEALAQGAAFMQEQWALATGQA